MAIRVPGKWHDIGPAMAVIAICCCLLACSNRQLQLDVMRLPALTIAGAEVAPAQQLSHAPVEYPLALDTNVQGLVDAYVDRDARPEDQIREIKRLIFGPAFLAVSYDPGVTGTALEVVRSGRANCLGFSHLFIAMARYAGIDANYQQVEVKPNWNRQGQWLLVARHVNVRGRLGRKSIYSADIDTQIRERQLDAHEISDASALAQHYNNLAMEQLLNERIGEAWGLLMRGLEIAPHMDDLWVNLGTVYKRNDQWDAAQWSYQQALLHNSRSLLALQHLQRLHSQQGELKLAAQYAGQLERYRAANPYHQALLAAREAQKFNWPAAGDAIARAIALKPDELEFHAAAARYRRQLELQVGKP